MTNELMTLNKISIFKENSNGKPVFKAPTKKQLDSNYIATNFDKYNLRQINKLMGHTDLILIEPDSASLEQISVMCQKARQRKFIPVFKSADCTLENFSSISFGVFEGSNPDGNELFIFVYLSQLTDIMDIEDELEKPLNFSSDNIVDALNDMFATCAGADYRISYTINLKNNPSQIKIETNTPEIQD